MNPSLALVIIVGVTTAGWMAVAFLTRPADRDTLQRFYDAIRPIGPGWKRAVTVRAPTPGESPAAAFACWFLGCVVVYGALFGTGYLLYGNWPVGLTCLVVAGGAAAGLFRLLPRVGFA